MPTNDGKTFLDQYNERVAAQNVRQYEFVDRYNDKLNTFAIRAGMKTEKQVKLEDKVRDMGRELHHNAQMGWEEIREMKDAAKRGGATVAGGAMDIAQRPLWTLAAGASSVLRVAAPQGTDAQKAIKAIGDSYIVATDMSSNPALGVFVAALTARRIAGTEKGKAAMARMVDRTMTVNALGALVGNAGLAMSNELFSGIGDFRGKKRGYTDIARDMGIIEGRSISQKLQDAFGKSSIEIWRPFMDNLEIGFSDTGDEWLKFAKGGFADPSVLGVTGAPLEILGDPITYVTLGSSGFVKALGKPLSKIGVKQLTKNITATELKFLANANLRQGTREAATFLAHEHKNIRRAAEELLVEQGRHNIKLFRPRGEIRFMGKPIGRLGGKPGTTTVAARIAQGIQLEKGMGKFRNALVEGHNAAATLVDKAGMRVMLSQIGYQGRRLQAIFQADLSKIPEMVVARQLGEGVASAKGASLDKLLSSLKPIAKNKTKSKVALEALSDPLSTGVNTPGLPADVAELVAKNDEISQLAKVLNQESEKAVPLADLERLAMHTRLDGHNLLSRQLDERVALGVARRADIVQEIESRLLQAADDVANATDDDMLKEATKNLNRIKRELDPKNLDKVTAIPKTELFFRNSDTTMEKYLGEFATQYSKLELDKIKNTINQMVNSGVVPKDLDPGLQALYQLRLNLKNAAHAGDKALAKKAYDLEWAAMKNMLEERAHMVLAKGDRGGVMSLLSREDVLNTFAAIKKDFPELPKIRVVTNPLEHVSRRGANNYGKEAMIKITNAAAHIASDDDAARRVFEEHLMPVGVLRQHKNVDLTKVDAVLDRYKLAQQTSAGKAPTFNIGDAVNAVDSFEEKQLIIRNWLVGDDLLGLPRTKGTLPKRLHQVFAAMGDEPGFVATAKVPSAKSSKEAIARRFAEEAQDLRKALARDGYDIKQMFPRINMTGMLAGDGTRWVPFRQLKYEDGHWKLLSEGTGDELFMPDSLKKSLMRLGDRGIADPQVGLALSAWDGYTNGVKVILTAIGGYPSFQLRNLYSNVAFGLTGAHIHMLQPKAAALAETLSRNSVDPRLTWTGAAHTQALRHRAMSMAALENDVSQAGLERALTISYSGGRKKARELAKNSDAMRKEAEATLKELNTVVLTDDFGKAWTQAEIMREVHLQGVEVDPRALAEFTGQVERFRSDPEFAKEWMNKAAKAGLSVKDYALDKALRSNAYIEQFSRQQLFLSYLQRGVGPEEAGALVNKWLLNYQSLSPFERKVMKRIFPFYTFYRKAAPLMAESVFTRPGMTGLQGKILQAHGTDPVLTFGSEDGERVVMQNDGKVAYIGNVDLPINTLNLFGNIGWAAEIIGVDNPDVRAMRKRGLKDVALLVHPAFHAVISASTDYEMFSGKSRPYVKMNALGAALEKTAPGLFASGTIVKDKGYNGEDVYKFDRGAFTFLVQMSGLSRISSNADRIQEGVGEMRDGEVRGLMQWFTGLDYHEMTGNEQKIDQLRAVYKTLEDEAVRRTDRRRFSRTFIPKD